MTKQDLKEEIDALIDTWDGKRKSELVRDINELLSDFIEKGRE